VGSNYTFTGNLSGAIRDLGTATQYQTDTEKPSPPASLTATPVSYNRVDLAWGASSDNVGVTGYTIYRGGQQIGTVGGTTLAYQDTTVLPNTAYTYTVTAKDAAGNESLPSNQAAATTPPAPPDNEKPSPPANLTATPVSYDRVDLGWGASSDNIGITGYTIYRDGSQIDTVGGATLAYQDTTVSPNTAYTYTVTARDAAGNESLPSNQAQATTPPAPSSLTFAPVADAYVNESSPTTNYGSSSSLRADGSPINRSFLRFDVQGVVGTVTSAKLRIYANSSSSVGHSVQGITDTTWIESAITYASFQPTLGAVVGSSGPFSGGGYIEVDVTPLVAGDGLVSLAVSTTHTTAISYGSRESANPPQLVVTLG
jgi:chitodextrinase